MLPRAIHVELLEQHLDIIHMQIQPELLHALTQLATVDTTISVTIRAIKNTSFSRRTEFTPRPK
jgi:hypothetical protein